MFCFGHATPSHYHHHADLLTCIEHIWWNILEVCNRLLSIFCQECIWDVVSSLDYLPDFFAICGVVCVKLAHASLGDREDIFITLLIIIMSLSHCGHIFSMVVYLRWLYHHMLLVSYILGKLGFVYFVTVQFTMYANNQVPYGLMVILVCLHLTLPHYHHYADVSEGIEILKYLPGTFCQVCV